MPHRATVRHARFGALTVCRLDHNARGAGRQRRIELGAGAKCNDVGAPHRLLREPGDISAAEQERDGGAMMDAHPRITGVVDRAIAARQHQRIAEHRDRADPPDPVGDQSVLVATGSVVMG